MNALLRAIAAAGMLALLTACNRGHIDGQVTNRRGEALPGVTVTVAGTSLQDLTDSLGRYRIDAPSGAATLVFSKSGYTTATLEHDPGQRGGPAEALLWVLPMNAGVYVVTDRDYRETSWVLPKQHYLEDGSAAFGIELPAEVIESTNEPFLVTHRTPRYNAQLSRLVAEKARLAGIGGKSIEVWVEAGTMAVGLEPLDPAESLLLRVQIGRGLEPGVYGIHWGAIEGYTTLDNRVFLFRVPEELESAETTETGDSAADPATAAETSSAPAAGGEEAKPAETPAPVAPKPESPAQDILEPADEGSAPQP